MSAASYYRLKQLKFSCAFLEVLKQRIILHCERTHIMKSENNRQNNYASNPFSFRTKKTPLSFLRKLSKSTSISHPRVMISKL